MPGLLEMQDATKEFGGVLAIDHLSFEVKEGEITGLIGPNGAGKSTLFNLINGVFPADTGRILFRGIDITGKPPYRIARSALARPHQIVPPLADMTVLENCTLTPGCAPDNLRLAGERAAAREPAAPSAP